MIDLKTPIIPYEGTGIFKLDKTYNEIKSLLENLAISYNVDTLKSNETDPVWKIIEIENSVELFFAKNRLFKIILKGNFKGSLPNGINLNTTINDAQKIDSTLKFNDWEEIFESKKGYWVEDDLDTKKLNWITIFIPALERDDFFDYNW